MPQVALSTMWGVDRFYDMKDFVIRAYEMGFSHVEFNYQLTPALLEDILVANKLKVSSLHSPCPSPLLGNGLWAYRLSLSSLDEAERGQALGFACSTMELAKRLGAGWVILHLGSVAPALEVERSLRQLYRGGGKGSEEFEESRERLARMREALASAYLEMAVKSLKELMAYAQKVGVALALETRAYVHEIPNLPEMVWLLEEIGGDGLGYWHDVGHAEAQARLGFASQGEWLEALGHRVVGIHLHDVRGLLDHRPPGSGEVNWELVSRHLPPQAIRVFEVASDNGEKDLKKAFSYLKKKGILPQG